MPALNGKSTMLPKHLISLPKYLSYNSGKFSQFFWYFFLFFSLLFFIFFISSLSHPTHHGTSPGASASSWLLLRLLLFFFFSLLPLLFSFHYFSSLSCSFLHDSCRNHLSSSRLVELQLLKNLSNPSVFLTISLNWTPSFSPSSSLFKFLIQTLGINLNLDWFLPQPLNHRPLFTHKIPPQACHRGTRAVWRWTATLQISKFLKVAMWPLH